MADDQRQQQHKAILVSGFANMGADVCDVCSLGPTNTPVPAPHQVLVRMLCRPIHLVDSSAIRGYYPGWQPQSFPSVPGTEGMGVVHQVGKNVTNVKVGQRVFPCLHFVYDETRDQGSWQDYILGPASSQILVPDSVSDEVASQFLVNPWTVYGMFDELKPPKGEYVIQTGAASVLGRMFIQYAHYHGVKTINLVRRNEQKDELRSLGADEVLNYLEEDVQEQVKKITHGKLAFAGIDCVAGEMTKLVASCVKNGSTILVYGALGAFHVDVGIQDIIGREVKLHGFALNLWINRLSHDEMMEVAQKVMDLLAKKIIQPLSGEKFPLEMFKEAIAKSEVRTGGVGKVFLLSC